MRNKVTWPELVGRHLRDAVDIIDSVDLPPPGFFCVDVTGDLTGCVFDPDLESGEYVRVLWDEAEGRVVGVAGASSFVILAGDVTAECFDRLRADNRPGVPDPNEFWTCDKCLKVFTCRDEDGSNDDPIRVDTGPPHFNLIGYYCEDCGGEILARYQCVTCKAVGLNPPGYEGQCERCSLKGV